MRHHLRIPGLFFWLCFIAALVAPSSLRAESIMLVDGFGRVAATERSVLDPVEVQRRPLFENAPFLRLFQGDKLVKARMGRDGSLDYYLCSGGKYYQLPVDEAQGELRLKTHDAPPYSMLFDWDFTLENATALCGFVEVYNGSIPPKLAETIFQAAQKDFPELVPEFANCSVSLPNAVSVPGQQYYEFQGLVLDPYNNGLNRYVLRIGPGLFEASGDVIVRGVPPVPQRRDGQDKRWQAAETNYQKFQALIRKAYAEYFASLPDPPIYSSRILEYSASDPKVCRVIEKLIKGDGATSLNHPHQMALLRRGGCTVLWYYPETKTFTAEGSWVDQAHFWAWFANIAANSRRLLKEPFKFAAACGLVSEEVPKPPLNTEKAPKPLKSPQKK